MVLAYGNKCQNADCVVSVFTAVPVGKIAIFVNVSNDKLFNVNSFHANLDNANPTAFYLRCCLFCYMITLTLFTLLWANFHVANAVACKI